MKKILACLIMASLLTVSSHSRPAASQDTGRTPPAGEWIEPKTGAGFVLIPAGEFVMGSKGRLADESPPHTVRVSSFYLTKHEITQAQWRKVMGTSPSSFQGCEECPVEQISWDEATEFLRKASELTGRPFRLPTEAEWEYAAGGGKAHQKWPGTNDEKEPGEFSWFSGNFAGKTRPVGLKPSNLFGLHDMGGNVAEWCADWYSADYYRTSPADNPKGPLRGTRKVIRGGSWLSGPQDTRTARRGKRHPSVRSPTIGFRVAVDPPVSE